MQRRLRILMAMLSLLLLGTSSAWAAPIPEPEPDPATHALVIDFVEKDAYVEPYATRVIITPRYLRFDDGEGAADFILYDRKRKLIYSVTEEDHSVMVLRAKHHEAAPPVELRMMHRAMGEMTDVPSVNGVKPRHYQFLVNGEVCYEYVVIPGLLKDAVAAFKEFNAVIASDARLTVNIIPADVRNVCSVAMSAYAVNYNLMHGFPVQGWSPDGKARSLLGYNENVAVNPTWFTLPAGYRRFTVEDVRGGGGRSR
ncbi:MAG TPA: hypothetical protein ENJ01_01245 [Gammaproteobacteria bacterium]|nr:hypothetical protein [Gammaproteobacteria bacterium]